MDELHKNFTNFHPVPAHWIAWLSVITQLSTLIPTHQDSSNTNYYTTIDSCNSYQHCNQNAHTTWAMAASSLNLAAKQSTTPVNIVSLKELSAISINSPHPQTNQQNRLFCLHQILWILGMECSFNSKCRASPKMQKYLLKSEKISPQQNRQTILLPSIPSNRTTLRNFPILMQKQI